jgi:hypothetical protein
MPSHKNKRRTDPKIQLVINDQGTFLATMHLQENGVYVWREANTGELVPGQGQTKYPGDLGLREMGITYGTRTGVLMVDRDKAKLFRNGV